MIFSELVTRVREAIDEAMANDSQFLSQSTDEANLTRIIKSNVGAALLYVVDNAPIDKFDTSDIQSVSLVTINNENVGTVVIPDGVLKILDARLSSWPYYPAPVDDTSQVALMQQDQYARGSWDRPINVLTYNAEKKRVLKMYSAKEASDTLIFLYISRPVDIGTSFPDSSTIPVPKRLQEALVYQTAALTMTAFREEIAATLFAIAARYLSIEPTKEE